METLATNVTPPIERLRSIVLDPSRDLSLHAQLRNALQRMITEDFEDRARFYSETQLIDALGISQGTVRRALTDLANTGLILRKRAQATFVQKKPQLSFPRKLAVFVVDYRSANIARSLSTLHAACVDQGIEMLPLYTYQGQHLNKAYKQLNFPPTEGAVVILGHPTATTYELEQALSERHYQFVTIDTLLPNQRGHFVGPDNDTGVRLAIEHLTQLGHRRIALLVCEPDNANTRARIAAFTRYTQALGTTHSLIHDCKMVPWDRAYDAGRKAIAEIWALPSATRPTALFAVSDMGALGAMKWLLEQGVRIPGDISIIGFDGIDTGAVCHPALTSILQPYEQIITETIRLAKVPVTHPEQVIIKPTLLQRESTGPASAP
ncbi:substrate-binding domain-containing protein [Geminisphaera colitermitum]|uniref:substrate-binding domain-containing protein n=1 Tax=Geminisphaera colitermitum TaxID=1148786 RepID=UPI000158D030|nr:substrate-binding domain-containing protein [Geminisphaera colitermitum]